MLAVAAAVLGRARRASARSRRSRGALALARVPLVRGGLARQRRRPAADPADDARLRRGAARDRNGALARALLGCAVLVGLAFNTKTLAAYLVVPGHRARAIWCARPRSLARRLVQLLVAGAGDGSRCRSRGSRSSNSRPPRSARIVGSSTNNTELGPDVRLQRLRARRRPGRRAGADSGRASRRAGRIDAARSRRATRAHPTRSSGARPPSGTRPPTPAAGTPPATRPSKSCRTAGYANPIAFGGPPGPLRLFGAGLGDQGGWMMPFALFGLIALALWRCSCRRRDRWRRRTQAPRRADTPRPRPARPAAGGADRARRLVPGRGGRAELLQGDRPPLLRLGARPGHGGDGRRRRGRPRATSPSAGAAACSCCCRCAVRRDGRRAARAAGPRALHALVRARADRRRGARACSRCSPCAAGSALRDGASSLALLLVAPAAYAATTWLAPGGRHVPRGRPARGGRLRRLRHRRGRPRGSTGRCSPTSARHRSRLALGRC